MNFRHLTVLTLGLLHLNPGYLNASPSLSDSEDDNGVATQSARHVDTFDRQELFVDTSKAKSTINAMIFDAERKHAEEIEKIEKLNYRQGTIERDNKMFELLLETESEESVSSLLSCLKLLIPNFPKDSGDIEKEPHLRMPLVNLLRPVTDINRREKLAAHTNNLLGIGQYSSPKPVLTVLRSLYSFGSELLDPFIEAVVAHLNSPEVTHRIQSPHTLRFMVSHETIATFIQGCGSITLQDYWSSKKGIAAMRESAKLCTGMLLDLEQRLKLCMHIGYNCRGNDIPYEQFARDFFPLEYKDYTRKLKRSQVQKKGVEKVSRKRAREEAQTQADEAQELNEIDNNDDDNQ